MKVERIAQKITGAIGQGGKKLTAKASAAAQTAKKRSRRCYGCYE